MIDRGRGAYCEEAGHEKGTNQKNNNNKNDELYQMMEGC